MVLLPGSCMLRNRGMRIAFLQQYKNKHFHYVEKTEEDLLQRLRACHAERSTDYGKAASAPQDDIFVRKTAYNFGWRVSSLTKAGAKRFVAVNGTKSLSQSSLVSYRYKKDTMCTFFCVSVNFLPLCPTLQQEEKLAKAAEKTGRCKTLQRLLTAAFSEPEPPLFSPHCCERIPRLSAQHPVSLRPSFI